MIGTNMRGFYSFFMATAFSLTTQAATFEFQKGIRYTGGAQFGHICTLEVLSLDGGNMDIEIGTPMNAPKSLSGAPRQMSVVGADHSIAKARGSVQTYITTDNKIKRIYHPEDVLTVTKNEDGRSFNMRLENTQSEEFLDCTYMMDAPY